MAEQSATPSIEETIEKLTNAMDDGQAKEQFVRFGTKLRNNLCYAAPEIHHVYWGQLTNYLNTYHSNDTEANRKLSAIYTFPAHA